LSPQLLRTNVERRRERYDNLRQRLSVGLAVNAQAHRARLAAVRDRILNLSGRTSRCIRVQLDQRHARVERAERLLIAFSYRKVLERGFALVRDAAGAPLRSASAVASGARLDIEFADGRVAATAGEGAAPPASATSVSAPRVKPQAKPQSKPPKSGGGQGDLF
jgi:exodeoxyribonuclease VII large subunit